MLLEPEQIKEIAQALSRELDHERLWFWAITFATTIVATAIGSYAGAYFKKRGEDSATAATFDAALDRMARSVEANERIKNDVASVYSKQTLYRQKLEEIFLVIETIENMVVDDYHNSLEGKGMDPRRHKLTQLQMLQDLYFQKCMPEFFRFLAAADAMLSWTRKLRHLQRAHGVNSSQALMFRALAEPVNMMMEKKVAEQFMPPNNGPTPKIIDDFNGALGDYQEALIEKYRDDANLPGS